MNTTDFVWVSVSTLLVLMMVVPALALFYGGLVRSKNVLSVLAQVMTTFCLAIVIWFIYGYSLAFTEGNAFFGGLSRLFFSGMANLETGEYALSGTIPELSFAAFQATFAGITCALIVGGLAERVKFPALIIFTILWVTLAYVPIAHMVWGPGGWLLEKGALDFAGGTVVHINAGVAGLVGAWYLGPRLGYGREAMPPPQLAHDHDRRRLALGWLVWLQRGVRIRRQYNRGTCIFQHLDCYGGRGSGMVVHRMDAQGQALAVGFSVGGGCRTRRHYPCRRACRSRWRPDHRRYHRGGLRMGCQWAKTQTPCR